MKQTLHVLALMILAVCGNLAAAAIPQLINYQGRVVVEGVNFDSASAGHNGLFKFALVNGDGSETYWSNDGTSVAGGEPVAAVSLPVSKGLYSVALGDTSQPLAMTPLNAGALAHDDVRLRIWFDDGTHGSQLLSPDQRITAVAYAVMAGEVPDGSVSGAKIAMGAVGSAQLGADSVQGSHIANGAVDNTKLATSAITLNAGTGLGGGGTLALGGTISLENTGVTSLTGGGGITISNATGSITLGSNATATNIPDTIVQRDVNGDFSAGKISAASFVGSGAGLTGVRGTLPWQVAAGIALNADANTGYLADNAALVTITLPTAAAVGDIVRVSGVGAGGSAIVPEVGQSITGFGPGLGPTGSQGASTAVQFIGNAAWQTLNESQLAAGTVQGPHIKIGAVDNTKLANPSVTLNTGSGLAGGGVVALGDTMNLSIPNGGIGSAHLAPNAALANLNAGPSRQLLGTWDATQFKGLNLLETGTGLNKPALLFDRGIAPKARIFFQGAQSDTGWSGLHFAINADRHDADSYIRDTESLGYSVLNMEYNYLTPFGDHWAEINWTVSDSAGFPRRIFNFTSSMDDYRGPTHFTIAARGAIVIPEYDTTPGPAFLVAGYQGYGNALQFIFQNDNSASPAAATQIVLRGVGSAGLPSSFSSNWAIGTDRYWAGTNNFYIFDAVAVEERLFIDENGNVGLGTTAPSEKLDVNGSAKIAGSVAIGSGAATWTQGNAAPTAAEPDGSLYSRVNSGVDSGLYVRENGVWVKK